MKRFTGVEILVLLTAYIIENDNCLTWSQYATMCKLEKRLRGAR